MIAQRLATPRNENPAPAAPTNPRERPQAEKKLKNNASCGPNKQKTSHTRTSPDDRQTEQKQINR